MHEDLIPPSDEEIWNEWEFMGTHEAAWWLTDCPRNGDSSFYPDPTQPFYPEQYEGRFQHVYEDLERSIKHQLLFSKRSTAVVGVQNSVRPRDVILWALGRHKIPNRIQSAIGLHLDDDNFSRRERALINKILFQCIFTEYPRLISLDDFLNHTWLKLFEDASYCNPQEQKALKRHLEEAIGFKAERGKNNSKSKLKLKPIHEVMRTTDGVSRYNMRAFFAIVNIICHILIEKSPENFRQITPEAFMERVRNHNVVSPYLQKAPQILLEKLNEICSTYIWRSPIKYLAPGDNRHLKE